MALLRGALPVAFALTLLAPLGQGIAVASCAPLDAAAQAAGAEVIAFGTVTETRQTFVAAGGVIKFRPERVLKGALTREVQVYLGPSHGGGITSVDYTAVTRGEQHTLYLRAFIDDGAYETNACSGSHVGAPTATEEKALGAGTLVAALSEESVSPMIIAAIVALVALAGVAVLFGIRRRRNAA
jgi:MYXO-CTERM domain-containing protein